MFFYFAIFLLRCDAYNIKYPRLGQTGFFEISFYYYEYAGGM